VIGHTVCARIHDSDFATFARAAFANLNLTYPKFYKMDSLCKLGFLAMEYLLAGNPDCRPSESTAIVMCSSSGSSDSDAAHVRNMEQPSPAAFVYTLPSIVAGELAIRHGIKGETAFFICGRDNDSVMRQYAAGLLENGAADSCIAGYADCAAGQYYAELYFLQPR
jgi:hypothetical protein